MLSPPSPPLQERLLLSLLPAHIAMEMKAEIIQRLQGPKAGQMENTNNFHNLYVKRHTNVRYGAPCRPTALESVVFSQGVASYNNHPSVGGRVGFKSLTLLMPLVTFLLKWG